MPRLISSTSPTWCSFSEIIRAPSRRNFASRKPTRVCISASNSRWSPAEKGFSRNSLSLSCEFSSFLFLSGLPGAFLPLPSRAPESKPSNSEMWLARSSRSASKSSMLVTFSACSNTSSQKGMSGLLLMTVSTKSGKASSGSGRLHSSTNSDTFETMWDSRLNRFSSCSTKDIRMFTKIFSSCSKKGEAWKISFILRIVSNLDSIR